MNTKLRKKCAEAIVISDAKMVLGGHYGKNGFTLGEIAEYAAEACIAVYLKETKSTDGSSDV